jgi:hypothetical protein
MKYLQTPTEKRSNLPGNWAVSPVDISFALKGKEPAEAWCQKYPGLHLQKNQAVDREKKYTGT